jgi:hypothetical protein
MLELAAELGQDRARAPAGMSPTEPDDPGFDLRRDLVRAAVRAGAAVGKGAQPLVRVAGEPAVDRPPVHPVAGGDVGHLGAVQYLPHGEVTLLNHGQLLQHAQIPLGPVGRK